MAESSSQAQSAWRCSFNGCRATFKTKALLRKHKMANADHEYCKLCDEDFQDEQEFTVHKIQSDNHIVCPACGEEFKSEGGCRLHVMQMHGARQKIPCAGCGEIFDRAGALMGHIEQNGCKKIKPIELLERRARREVLARFLANPEAFRAEAAAAAASEALSQAPDVPVKSAAAGSKAQTQGGAAEAASTKASTAAEGGVQLTEPSLIDSEEAPALKEEVLMPEKAPQKEWPDLETVAYRKGDGPDDLLTGLKSLMAKEPTEVWGRGDASNSLFPEAIKKANPSTQLVSGEREPERGSPATLHEAWDPRSKNFRPEMFYQPVVSKYYCPHPACRSGFRSLEWFKQHLFSSDRHLPDRVNCPSCHKPFKTTTALVQHCEAPSTRCGIRMMGGYNKALDTLTGGLLETSGSLEDGTPKYKSVEPNW